MCNRIAQTDWCCAVKLVTKPGLYGEQASEDNIKGVVLDKD